MTTPSVLTSEQIPERVDAALDLLYSGINSNTLELVDTALLALPELIKEAMDAKQYHMLEKVVRGLKMVFVDDTSSKYNLLPKVISGDVSEDILELVLEHTSPTPTHYIWNAGISKMSSRLSLMLARNYIRFNTLDFNDVSHILSKLHDPLHQQAFTLYFEHILKSTIELDDVAYRKIYCKGSENIFKIFSQRLTEEKHLPLMTRVLLNNQDIALAHINRIIKQPGNTLAGLSFAAAAHLQNAGFERFVPACGIKLLNGHDNVDKIHIDDIKEFVNAMEMGINFDKDFVLGNLNGRQTSFILPQAIYYALTSKEIDLDDLVFVKNTIGSYKDKERESIEKSLVKGVWLSFRELYGNSPGQQDKEIVRKVNFMLIWTIDITLVSPENCFTTAVLGLNYFPEGLINHHPTLRDLKLAIDVGL